MKQTRPSSSRTPLLFAAVASIAACTGCRGPSATPTVPLDPAAGGTHADIVATAKENSTVPAKTIAKPPLAELKQKLTPLQIEVTQNYAT